MILNKQSASLVLFFSLVLHSAAVWAAENQQGELAPSVSASDSSLRSYVKEETADSKNEQPAEENGDGKTWINNLVSTVAEKGAQVISANTDDQAPQYRTNASVFDISGVMLRMNVKQTMEAMQKRGYQRNSEKYEIPNFIRWRYEEQCRNQGVVGYERTEACVIKMAQKNKKAPRGEPFVLP